MCGLAGLFDTTDRRPLDGALARRMTSALAHRGPDGDGFHEEPGVILGHRRLAIIDLSTGDQPMYNEDGRVALVFNGEIFNYRALTRELAALGHVFRTRSDTEVIVHAWEQWGPACAARLRGQFALALYDARDETLFLARDPVGEKPMYYALLPDGVLLFGSELKALTRHPDLDRALDPRAVEDFLAFGYIPDPKSIYRRVAKLPAGHGLVVRRGRPLPDPRPYWDLGAVTPQSITPMDAEAELIHRLREAVEMRLMADVPLGAFLSGGVDSSGVVAVMAGQVPDPVRTFSIGFAAREFDESAYARTIADRYATRHHARRVDPDDLDPIQRLAGMFDEPFGDSSALPTYAVAALAREHVTVALSGDGGDEIFAGYRRYAWHCREERLRGRLPAGLRQPLFAALARGYPPLGWAPRWLRARHTFHELSLDAAGGYFESVARIGDELRRDLRSPELDRALQGYRAIDVVREAMAAAPSDDPLAVAQYVDLKTWLSGDILVKVDRTSMARSLEVRVPLLDPPLIEWAWTLPAALKLKGSQSKVLLKRALEPLVPNEILYRPKQGFSIPLARWFRGPLRDVLRAALTGPRLAATGLFRRETVTRLLDDHQSGRQDHSAPLWLLWMFDEFLRHAQPA